MNLMSAPSAEPADLLDLKLLPAWVKKVDAKNHYEHYTGEEAGSDVRSRTREGMWNHRGFRSRERKPESQRAKTKPDQRRGRKMPNMRGDRHRNADRAKDRRSPERDARAGTKLPEIDVRFLPRQSVFENVVTQIKSASVAYSLFTLARLFLEKPGRYEVCLRATGEAPIYQLGDGVISIDREFLDRNAFRFAQHDFYQIDVAESEPIKGNFSNVARCRLSRKLLGPTNYHTYQPQLRSLYEQRFSRRMSFAEYQRQVEIVSDPALVERWKDEARKVTTYTTLRQESPVVLSSVVETERHFRSNYLPGLIRSMEHVTIGGSLSRSLPDRLLNHAIEQAWVGEARSPSNMMQELATRFRQNELHIFRHRRGMLFVSPVRVRAFVHEQAGVAQSVNSILAAVSASDGITRKQLFEKLTGNGATEDGESRRLALASDLRWLINEGHLIEFNDGSLDLPRMKRRPQEAVSAEAVLSSSSIRPAVEETQLVLATSRALTLYSPQP
jgi:hypothetical protein